MHLDPGQRYQRAGELRRDLERLLSAVLRGNPAARIVGFLRERGQMAQADLTLVASEEVEAAEPVSKPATILSRMRLEVSVVPPSAPRRLLRVSLFLFLVLLVLAGALGVAWWLAPEQLQGAAENLARWLQGLQAAPG